MTCFAEAGGQHVPGMARAVELLGLRACLSQSTMDSGEGLPASWGIRTTDQCIQVEHAFSYFKLLGYGSIYIVLTVGAIALSAMRFHFECYYYTRTFYRSCMFNVSEVGKVRYYKIGPLPSGHFS